MIQKIISSYLNISKMFVEKLWDSFNSCIKSKDFKLATS